MLPTVIVIPTIIILITIMWAYFNAQRLHRLHIRTDSARASLEAALNRRGAVIAALHPELTHKAAETEAVGLHYQNFAARIEKERELLSHVPGLNNTQKEDQLPPALVDAHTRVQLAQRFYDAAVTDTRALRTRPLIRLFHLGGRAKLPEYFEL